MDSRDQRQNSTASSASEASNNSQRRGSSSLFASLNQHAANPAIQARRQSMSDQKPKPGIFGQMWNNYVRGDPNTK